MFFCTLIGAAAQMLIKQGSAQLATHVTLGQLLKSPALFFHFALGMVTNTKLFFGYSFYAVNVLLIAMALKGRELSRLYPIIALTYVWVTLLSLTLLNEHINFFKAVGICFIVGGVSLLGRKK